MKYSQQGTDVGHGRLESEYETYINPSEIRDPDVTPAPRPPP